MKHAFKKIMALVLALAVIIGVLPSVFAASIGDFKDVKDDAWYAKYVEYVVFQDLMNGTGATTFEPDSALTRAMTATVLWRIAGEPPVYNKSTFTDLKADWYKNAVAWAQANKVVNGITATTFEPDTFVTREQIVTMMWRYKGSPKVEGDFTKDFKDASKISAYAKDAFNWAISVGIINGDKGNLNPQNNATRAEFAKIIYQYAELTKPCSHVWDEGKVTKEATCTEAGEKLFTCTKCGATKTEVIAAKGHTYGEDGKCTVCGAEKPKPTPDPKPSNEYVLTNELKDGDEVVIYNPGYGKAIKNETDNNWYLVAQEVTPADNKITTDDTTIVWTVKKNEDGTFSFVNGDNAITAWYSSSDKGEFLELTNDANYEGGDSKWNLTAANATEKTFYISSATLSGAKGAGYMECYTKKEVVKVCGFFTGTPSEKDYGFQFFVKGATTPDPDPKPDPDPDPKPGNEYVLTNELKDGDEVVIYNPGYGKAIKNETDNNWYLIAQDVTPADNKITTDDTTIVWKVKKNEDGTFSFVNGDNAVTAWYSSNTKGEFLELTNDANYEGGDSKWNLTAANATEKTFYISSATLSGAKGAGYMECYTKKEVVKVCGFFTGTPSEKDYGFQFFVKGATTPDPDPKPDPDPDPKPGNEYVLTNELKDGDEVVIYNPGYGKAIKNETDNNWYLIAQDVTPADNKITTDDTTIVWKVKKNEDGTFSFVNGDNAVTAWYSSNTKGEFLELTNDANYEGGDSKWNLTAANATEKTFYISSATLSGAKGAGYMECYTKKEVVKVCGFFTGTPSEKDYGFQFFVKGATTPDPDPKPDPDPTPDPAGEATIIFAPSDVWEDGTGYQLLLDKDANTYGTLFDVENGFVNADETTGVVPAADYAQFEYKLPENADGDPETENFLVGATKTVKVPAGTYDIAVTNPCPASQYELDGTTYEDPAWIYFAGNGTLDNYTFEAGKTYTISVIVNPDYDETSDTTTYDLVKITTDGTTPDPDPEPVTGDYAIATDLNVGDVVVLVATHNSKYYAVANDGTTVKNALNGLAVTVADGNLDIGTADVLWTVCAGSADGTITLKSSTGKYIVWAGSGTQLTLGDTGTDITPTCGNGTSVAYFGKDKNGNDRQIVFRMNGTVPQFRAYASSNSTDEYSKVLTFWKATN